MKTQEEREQEQREMDEARQVLADRMDAWLEEHAEEDVQKGARRLVFEDRASWMDFGGEGVQYGLVTGDGEVLVTVLVGDDDFGVTQGFWAAVES